jgi:RNA polymerase sigma factor (sigma-70 family)
MPEAISGTITLGPGQLGALNMVGQEPSARWQGVDTSELESQLTRRQRLLEAAAAGLHCAARRLRDGNDVAEVVQDVLIWACGHWQQLASIPHPQERALLLRVLRDAAVDLFRREERRGRRQRPLDGEAKSIAPQVPSSDAPLLDAERERLIAEALQNIPGQLRNVIAWRYWGRLTWKEIGHRLGFSERHARNLRNEALNALRGALDGRV